MAPTNRPPQAKHTEQNVLNNSYDEDFDVSAVEELGYDGQALQRRLADSMAMKVTVSGDITYMAFAKPGTSQSTAKWQAMKIDTSSGVVKTYADGDSNFDNIATDLTALTYS